MHLPNFAGWIFLSALFFLPPSYVAAQTEGHTIPTASDADGDGIPDAADECRYEFGTAKAKGCPDADNDGVPDSIDRCKNTAGTAYWYGCPDADSVPETAEETPPANVTAPVVAPAENPATPPEAIPDGFVVVKGGTFVMGSPETETERSEDELQHLVTLDDFYISPFEVTQREWRELMGNSPSQTNPGCDECPVTNVSWNDIQVFLKKLNARHPKRGYRLPTDAEWEYAARGGNQSKGYKYAGSNEDDLKSVAWFAFNSDYAGTRPVGKGLPNELGLYDMSGNVYEWCSDWWAPSKSNGPVKNPRGPASGNDRIIRSGSWSNYPETCRVSNRTLFAPQDGNMYIGFRLARS